MAKKGKLTPMMQQYMQIKEENKDCILFYFIDWEISMRCSLMMH